jgi:hypothetical protein
MGRFVSADDTRITLTQTSHGDVLFDRVKVQRVELVLGDPQVRTNAIVKGGLTGLLVAIVGTVSAAMAGANTPKAMVTLYSVTVGGGAGIGVLKSRGKGATSVQIYERL